MRKSKTKSAAMRRADGAFSHWIRQREMDDAGFVRCISCNMPFNWIAITNGHYKGRMYMSTRYDPQNCAPQCRADNQAMCGKTQRVFMYRGRGWHMQPKDVTARFEAALMLRYGPTILDELQQRANAVQKTSIVWFDGIAEKYLKLLAENHWTLPGEKP